MTTWHKRDWQQFYELARRPMQRRRPPRPIYPSGLNRVLPAAGFSLSELDDANIDLELAERLGLTDRHLRRLFLEREMCRRPVPPVAAHIHPHVSCLGRM